MHTSSTSRVSLQSATMHECVAFRWSDLSNPLPHVEEYGTERSKSNSHWRENRQSRVRVSWSENLRREELRPKHRRRRRRQSCCCRQQQRYQTNERRSKHSMAN